jgi:hypothetical protein
MSALVATALAVTSAGGATASAPRTAVQARKAGPAPAWLETVRSQAVLHTRNGQVVTAGPDPRLAQGPGARDIAGWARKQALEKAATDPGPTASALARGADHHDDRPAPGRSRITVTEAEAAGASGVNDTLATAQRIPGFGTSRPLRNAADVTGVMAAGPVPTLTKIKPNVEDDSTPETAGVTGVSTKRPGATTTGRIGDNPPDPAEPGAGDVDLYALDLQAGQLFTAKLRTTSGDLQPLLLLFDADGFLLGDSFFDADFLNPSLQAPIRTAGRYFLLVAGFTLVDENDKETVTTGDYALDLYTRRSDTDVYKVSLAAGDVLGVNVSGQAAFASLFDSRGTEVMGSGVDASSAWGANTPLPGGGNATAEVVAPKKGTYYVSVTGGDGPYALQVEAYRPGGTGKRAQTIYLDLDGERFNTNIFFGPGVRTFSPLSDFLPAWGLKPSDRRALGRIIKRTVEENIAKDLARSGLGADVSVKVVTSDEVRSPWGRPGVTRVVVGGTIDETGIPTIGLAQHIDVGNFDREETAIVLLDTLSEPADFGDPASLNTWIGPRSDKRKFVGTAVGNVVSHEVGHLLGNWHTDSTNGQVSVMDSGGVFEAYPNLYGVGPDGVGGTADDTDTDFVVDTFDLFEGFTGQENTIARTTWAVSE